MSRSPGKAGRRWRTLTQFMNVKCPQVRRTGARRESDTMDTFVDSSWYFYRYCDPHNDTAPFDSAKIAATGFPSINTSAASTHAILHLIYSRFWTKVMRDHRPDLRTTSRRNESVHAGHGA